jgi:hypothetical protein
MRCNQAIQCAVVLVTVILCWCADTVCSGPLAAALGDVWETAVAVDPRLCHKPVCMALHSLSGPRNGCNLCCVAFNWPFVSSEQSVPLCQ